LPYWCDVSHVSLNSEPVGEEYRPGAALTLASPQFSNIKEIESTLMMASRSMYGRDQLSHIIVSEVNTLFHFILDIAIFCGVILLISRRVGVYSKVDSALGNI
jgi:hypothetical protein